MFLNCVSSASTVPVRAQKVFPVDDSLRKSDYEASKPNPGNCAAGAVGGDRRPHYRRRRRGLRPPGSERRPDGSQLELASVLVGASWDGPPGIRLSPRGVRRHGTRVPQRRFRELYVVPIRRRDLRPDEDWRHHRTDQRRAERRADGAFTYDSRRPVSNSWDDPGQFALFRLVRPETHALLSRRRGHAHQRSSTITTTTTTSPGSRPTPFLNRARCCSSARGWPHSPCERSSRPARRAPRQRSRRHASHGQGHGQHGQHG